MHEEKRIDSIQLLRLIAAISIIVYHSNIMGEVGYFGVEILFVVSGFVIMKSTELKKKYFLRRRLIRIIPLYWISTIFLYIILLYKPELSLMSIATEESLFRSLFFLPQNLTGVSTVPLISVGWTINYEIYFYFIFGIAMTISHKYRGLITSCMILLLCNVAGGLGFPLVENIFNPILIECVWGIALYYLYSILISKRSNKNQAADCIAIVMEILLFIYLWFDNWNISNNLHRSFRLGIPAFIFCSIFLFCFVKIKIPKWIVEMGNMTYSVYLIEYFTTKIYKMVIDMLPLGRVGAIMIFLIMLAITFALSYISYQLIEKRFTKVILNKFAYQPIYSTESKRKN